MIVRRLTATAALLLLPRLAWADASYQSTTEMTGGTLVNSIRSMPFAPAAARSVVAPTTTITVVHGNQKAVISKESTELYDIDKETITRLNNEKKTYTVMTFAQMRQMMKDMPQKMAEMQAKMKQIQSSGQPATDYKTTFDTQVKNTGATKVVNGLNAHEWIVTLTTKVTMNNVPADSPITSLTYVTTTDVWVAPEPPEMQEVKDFDKRMYEKIAQGLDMKAITEQMQAAANGAGMGMMFGRQPGASDAMMQMSKEIAKMNGIRVLEVTTMSMTGMPAMPTGAAPAQATPPPSGGSVAGQVATDTATQTASGESGKLGVFGSALANSALGAFRRKKATPPPAAAPAAPTAATPGAPTAASDPNTLMSTTTQMTNFSRDPVPASAFAIPGGYKQVAAPSMF